MKKKTIFNFRWSDVILLLVISFVGFISCDSGDSSSVSTATIIEPIEDSSNLVPNQQDTNTGEEDFDPRIPRLIDPQLQVHLDSFLDEMEARNIPFDVSNLVMIFSAQDDNIAGVCFPSQGRVEIDFFFLFDDSDLKELVFHELGHCVLGMDHRPNSIMQATSFIGNVTPNLLDEFFDPAFFFAFDTNTTLSAEVKFFE